MFRFVPAGPAGTGGGRLPRRSAFPEIRARVPPNLRPESPPLANFDWSRSPYSGFEFTGDDLRGTRFYVSTQRIISTRRVQRYSSENWENPFPFNDVVINARTK